MCGRFSLFAALADLEERFGFVAADLAYRPSYNVAPTQNVLTVFNSSEGPNADYMRWGLIPPWSKDASFASRMINARAETIAEKPSFRAAFRKRRCLILADGFYEWQRADGGKRPMRIAMETKAPFAFAGIWETWKDPEGNRIRSCAIITTPAHEWLRPIHDRMPVILKRDQENLWTDPEADDPAFLRNILFPRQTAPLKIHEIAPLVNSSANNGPEILQEW